MDDVGLGRVTAQMYFDIYKEEKNNLDHRMKFIQKDLQRWVAKNEMNNNTRTTEMNRMILQERERKEAKINLQLKKVVIPKNDVELESQVDKIVKDYRIEVTDS